MSDAERDAIVAELVDLRQIREHLLDALTVVKERQGKLTDRLIRSVAK